MIEQIFQRIAVMSLSGSILTLLLLIFRKLTSRCFNSKWHYYTYVAAILVFLVPLSVKLPHGEPSSNDTRVNEMQMFIMPIEVDNHDNETAEITINQVPKTSIMDGFSGIIRQISVFLPYIWLCGFCIFFVFSVLSHILFVLSIKRISEPLYRKSFSGKRNLNIANSSKISSPVLVGIMSPTLYLPERELSDKDFQNILKHEATHLNRHDIEIKWLCLFARSLHWFNPFVHMLSESISKECEISCDIEATNGMDRCETTSYCETILSLVTIKDETAKMSVLGMGSTKKTLERRFKAIMEEKKTSRKIAIISAIITALVLLSTLTVSAILGGRVEKNPETDAEKPTLTKDTLADDVEGGKKSGGEKGTATTENDNAQDPVIKYITVDKATEYKLVPNSENTSGASPISAHYDEERHPAIDYKLPSGTIITSPFEGTVTKAEYDAEKGNHIIICEVDGMTEILFAHLKEMYVSKGDKVSVGDSIGTVGATGMATGPHLHVEYTENGEGINPVNMIFVEENGRISAIFSSPERIVD